MSDKPTGVNVQIATEKKKMQDILSEAEEAEWTYANHVQIAMTANDLVIDFFLLEPVLGKDAPKARKIQRVYLPIIQAKGLATALANVVDSYEKIIGFALPNLRKPDESDTIKLWE